MATNVNLIYINIFGYYYEPDGVTPKQGYIEFTPSSKLAHPDVGIVPISTIRANLDVDGRFDAVLLATNDPDIQPSGWLWVVDEKVKNGNVWYLGIDKDGPDPLDLTTVIVLPPLDPPAYGLPGSVGIGPNMVTGVTNTVGYGNPAELIIRQEASNTFAVDANIPEGPPGSSEGGVTVHGLLLGLEVDDHPQYVKKSGDTMSGGLIAPDITVDGTGRSGFFKTDSASEHALTAYQAALAGTGVALNVISDNPDDSAMYLSGTETGRGTLKIAHRGAPGDANASGISIDLQGAGTEAQGLFITSTDGGTTGAPLTVRHNGKDDFIVKADGKVGIGMPISATPGGKFEVVQGDDSTPGIVLKANSTGADNLIEFKRSSDGAVRTRVDAQAQIVSQQIAFFAGAGLQLGATSTDFGGGSGLISMKNAGTVPVSNPTAGVLIYVESGVLKTRNPSGDITPLSPEVAVGTVEPTDPNTLLWIDEGSNYP